MPTLSRLSGYQPAHHAPVLADVSGRRRRRMRLLGIGLITALLAGLTMMAVGLSGGPQAPPAPRAGLGSGTSPRSASGSGDGSSQPVPNPVILPPASPSRFPDRPPPGPGSAAANVGGGPAQVVTNQAGKTPPGRNHG